MTIAHNSKCQTAIQQRDTRLDVLRALALITIFINHVPGNFYERFSSRNFGFTDAAEAFVLISGIAVGLAYGINFRAGNRLRMTVKAWRRAGTLYLAHIMATVVTIGIFAGGALAFSDPELLTKINLEPVFKQTPEALFGIVTLGHQLGYNNILTMYAAVMVAVPGMLWIASRSLKLLVVLSLLVWFVAGLYRIGPPHYPNDGLWFLNPLSWQVLFAIGIAGTLHVKRGGTIPIHPGLVAVAVAYLLLSLAWVKIPLWGLEDGNPLPFVLGDFNKTFLTLPRLLHILALAYVFLAFPVFSRITRLGHDNPLAVMGRHGLAVFVAGTLLSMIGQVIGYVTETGFLLDTLILGTGIALQFALAYYYEWEKALFGTKSASLRQTAALSESRHPAENRHVPAAKVDAPSLVPAGE